MTVNEKAYAKINLILNVLNKRPDGYHEVDFVMTTVDLFDDVTVSVSLVNEVKCINAPHIEMTNNLAYQAWDLLRTEYNIDACVTITIDKRIPISAGMAGGSSDAAAVLRACNKLFNLKLTDAMLARVGSKIGSDIPFCIYQQPMRARGRGELLKPVNILTDDIYIVVVNPGVGLSTALVYRSYKEQVEHGSVNNLLSANNFTEFTNSLSNDLESTSRRLEPRINEMSDYIERKYDNRIMVSGSGPTVLVFCQTKDEMTEIYNYCKLKYKNSFCTKMRF